jgi:hypothetical protein
MIRITTKQYKEYKQWILHVVMLRFSGKIYWQKEYDGYTGLVFDNWRKKKQYWSWRDVECVWTFHLEIRKLKIFVCRYVNGV